MDYPKLFDSCPVCKGQNRLVESERNLEVQAGRMKPESTVPALYTQSIMFDLNDKSVIISRRQVPVLQAAYDICSDCGTLYCIRVDKKLAMMEPSVKGKGQG